jgi:hypothetical protein
MTKLQGELFGEYQNEHIYVSDFPDLAADWMVEKNGGLRPEEVRFGSDKKRWWKCTEGHEWLASPNQRTSAKSGCPHCFRANQSEISRQASPDYNLLTQHPEVCREWNFAKNNRTPDFYMPSSADRVWWICKNQHEWEASISNRTSQATGCPYCKNKRPTEDNNFAVLYPEIANEWHYERNKKSPKDYLPHSNQKVWWKCANGHEWSAAINNRITRGCPHCSSQTSKNEIRILAELNALFSDVRSRERIGKFEVDIFIANLNIAIEYDGFYWHQNQRRREILKESELNRRGIKLIRVRETPLGKTNPIDLEVAGTTLLKKTDLDLLIERLGQSSVTKEYQNAKTFVNETDYLKYLSYLPSPFPEHSLQNRHPELAKEWHPNKNDPLKPANFTPGSGQKVWWRCTQGHEWRASISHRALRGDGCRKCTGRIATSERNFAVCYPDIAKLWHPSKNNGAVPADFTPRSGVKVWWQCDVDPSHEWQVAINNITQPNRRLGFCPYCSGRKKL